MILLSEEGAEYTVDLQKLTWMSSCKEKKGCSVADSREPCWCTVERIWPWNTRDIGEPLHLVCKQCDVVNTTIGYYRAQLTMTCQCTNVLITAADWLRLCNNQCNDVSARPYGDRSSEDGSILGTDLRPSILFYHRARGCGCTWRGVTVHCTTKRYTMAF